MSFLKKFSVGFVVCGIVGGTYAGSKSSDPDVLARMGKMVGIKVQGALPSSSNLSGPMTAFRMEGRLPLEGKVQVRIRTDKRMEGTDVIVAAGANPGEVRLRGLVKDLDQAQRAVKLAESTSGVTKVIDEIAKPE